MGRGSEGGMENEDKEGERKEKVKRERDLRKLADSNERPPVKMGVKKTCKEWNYINEISCWNSNAEVANLSHSMCI